MPSEGSDKTILVCGQCESSAIVVGRGYNYCEDCEERVDLSRRESMRRGDTRYGLPKKLADMDPDEVSS